MLTESIQVGHVSHPNPPYSCPLLLHPSTPATTLPLPPPPYPSTPSTPSTLSTPSTPSTRLALSTSSTPLSLPPLHLLHPPTPSSTLDPHSKTSILTEVLRPQHKALQQTTDCQIVITISTIATNISSALNANFSGSLKKLN